MGPLFSEALSAIHFAHGDLSRGEELPERHGGSFDAGQHGPRLDPALELPVKPVARMRQQSLLLAHRVTLGRYVRPQCGERLVEARRAVDDDKLRRRGRV
jgi:hypothetical protein